jgi:hypothetical protein
VAGHALSYARRTGIDQWSLTARQLGQLLIWLKTREQRWLEVSCASPDDPWLLAINLLTARQHGRAVTVVRLEDGNHSLRMREDLTSRLARARRCRFYTQSLTDQGLVNLRKIVGA